MLNLGVHVSAAGKVYYVFERAKLLGCTTIQFFASNPRQWRKSSLSDDDVAEFNALREASGINPVVIHSPYTLNLAASKESFYNLTLKEFIVNLREADKLGAHYLVTHPGSHKRISRKEGRAKIVSGLSYILEETTGCNTMVLLENTAGNGSWIGDTFGELKEIMEGINQPERIGVCLDTAHVWAAGYKIDTPAGVDEMIDEIDATIGMDKIKVVHLNDNSTELGARKDRHEHIGKGKIGMSGIRAIVNHKKMAKVAFIMETPKTDDNDDMINLATVRELYEDGIF